MRNRSKMLVRQVAAGVENDSSGQWQYDLARDEGCRQQRKGQIYRSAEAPTHERMSIASS
jgi:hypothetical protein